MCNASEITYSAAAPAQRAESRNFQGGGAQTLFMKKSAVPGGPYSKVPCLCKNKGGPVSAK